MILPEGLLTHEGSYLINVVVPSSAENLFGRSYSKLVECVEDAEKTHKKMMCIFGGLMASGITFATAGGLLTYLYSMRSILGVVGGVGGIAAGSTSIVVAIGSFCYASKIDNNRLTLDAFLYAAEHLKNAHESFEDFKESPTVEKVKNLFDMFSKISLNLDWCRYAFEEDLNDQEGIIVDKNFDKFCKSTSRIYLMDAVVKLLNIKEYKQDFETTLNLTDAMKADMRCEPWKKLNVQNTNILAYKDFNNNDKNIISEEIISYIINIF